MEDFSMTFTEENTATLTDDDALSTITETIHKEIVRPQLDVNEFTIRYRFTPKSEKDNNLVATYHYKLLQLIHLSFKEMEIITKDKIAQGF